MSMIFANEEVIKKVSEMSIKSASEYVESLILSDLIQNSSQAMANIIQKNVKEGIRRGLEQIQI